MVDDIRHLTFGPEFDLVVSVGLIEHFPDSHKPEAIDWHRKFLKPDCYAIFTTPRNQWKSRLFYRVMADVMNHTYRELMTVEQMGLYIYENGFNILRHGYVKVHNAIIAQPRLAGARPKDRLHKKTGLSVRKAPFSMHYNVEGELPGLAAV